MLEAARAIDGWMTPSELAFLQALALSLPDAATVIELGSWHGRSTVAIRQALPATAQLYAVDSFSGDQVTSGAFDEAELERFMSNTSPHGPIEPVASDTLTAAARFSERSVDMVFVDADHSYDAVRRDLLAWAPKLKHGGVMCGHDWGWVGVRVAVRETYGGVGVFESIWYTRRKPGFHPFGILEKDARRLTGRLLI